MLAINQLQKTLLLPTIIDSQKKTCYSSFYRSNRCVNSVNADDSTQLDNTEIEMLFCGIRSKILKLIPDQFVVVKLS